MWSAGYRLRSGLNNRNSGCGTAECHGTLVPNRAELIASHLDFRHRGRPAMALLKFSRPLACAHTQSLISQTPSFPLRDRPRKTMRSRTKDCRISEPQPATPCGKRMSVLSACGLKHVSPRKRQLLTPGIWLYDGLPHYAVKEFIR